MPRGFSVGPPKIKLFGGVALSAEGHQVELGGPRPRAILARLAWDCGRVVSTDDLVDGIWGDDPPARVRASLQVHVSALRRSVSTVTDQPLILTKPPGYVLDLPPGSVDVLEFLALASSARAEIDARPHAEVLRRARLALLLWSGTPFAGIGHAPFVEPIIPWLEARRSELVDLVASCARTPHETMSVLPIVEHLAVSRPLDELIWTAWAELLVIAGRRRDALRRLAELRTRLWNDAGLRAGAAVGNLERVILDEDAPPAPAGEPNQIEVDGPDRRDDESRHVAAMVRVSRIVTVLGPIGVGTGRVASDAADELERTGWTVRRIGDERDLIETGTVADRHRPGHDLPGSEPDQPDDSVIVLLADGLPPSAARDLAKEVRSRCHGRILASATAPLRVRGEQLVRVDPLDQPSAMSRLVDAVTARRGRSPDDAEMELLRLVVRVCDGLDDVLARAAARLSNRRADRLLADATTLADCVSPVTERALNDVSPLARRIAATLSHLPGRFDDIDARGALTRPRPPDVEVRLAIDELVETGLAHFDPSQPEPYSIPRPTALAVQRIVDDVDPITSVRAVARVLAVRARIADAMIGTNREAAGVVWTERRRDVLESLARNSVATSPHRRALVRSLIHTSLAAGRTSLAQDLLASADLESQLRRRDIVTVATVALQADRYAVVDQCVERLGSGTIRDDCHLELTWLHVRSLRHRCAFEAGHDRLDDVAHAVVPGSTPGAMLLLERGTLLAMAGHCAEARGRLRAAREAFERLDLARGIGACWVYEAWCDLAEGRARRARPALERARSIAEDLGHRADVAFTSVLLAHAALALDGSGDPVVLATSAVDHFRSANDRLGLARALEALTATGTTANAWGDDAAESDWLRAQIDAPRSPLECAVMGSSWTPRDGL